MPEANAPPIDLRQALLETYAVNERMNQYLLESLDERAWRAEPPGGKGRTIAEIVAHIHNVRHMWLSASAKGKPLPPKLDRKTVTIAEAREALARSAESCAALLAEALERPDGRVRDFKPDVVGMVGYMIAHDAHHRGQIAMLARQAGFPLPKHATYGMWEWGKLWRDCGFERAATGGA